MRSHGAIQITPKLQVEIRNPEKFYNDVSRVLPDDHQLIEALVNIQPEIINAVRSYMGESWSSIAYHTRVSRQADDNALGKPTIIVFCYPGSACDYDEAEDHILQILTAVSVEVHLEFLPGQITPATPQSGLPLNLDDTPPKPLNGSSIGVGGNTSEAGSLGGWVVLNLPKQRLTIRCAITCYHVVRSPDSTIATHTDTHGVMLNDQRGHVRVQYPSAYDATYTLSELEKTCSQNPDDAKAAMDYKALSARFSNPGIGKVMLASGYRNKNGYLSDWALIESPSTFSANKPPPKEAILKRELPQNPPYTQNRDSEVREFGKVKLGDWVTKFGRTTGCTTGEINKMDRVTPGPLGMTTMRVEILSHFSDFAAPGDSGSMVTGQRGELLGFVDSIDKSPGRFDVGFMTTIQRIQDDIRAITGDGFISLD